MPAPGGGPDVWALQAHGFGAWAPAKPALA
jgi:hypothetical protein